MADFAALLQLAAERGASDLFLTTGAAPHLKIDGVTRPLDLPKLRVGEVKAMADGIMSQRQRDAFEETMEANLSTYAEGAGRFRINVYRQRGEAAMVVRLIKDKIPTFAELGLPPVCGELAVLKRGLVLFVGAAGSGKTTSLAAMVDYRAAHVDGHILTIEDPIEFHFRHQKSLVDQREVTIDTRSFGEALRNAMREAPDAIVIGEIRDQETAHHAIAYAETGHLCMSTMHSNNANQALERIINFFPENAQRQLYMDLSLNLKAVISQRLLPTVDGKLALATEVLKISSYMTDLIRDGRVTEIKDAIGRGDAQGMYTFDQSLYRLFETGRISQEEALRNADSQTDLGLRIRLAQKRRPEDATGLTIAPAPVDPRLTRK